MNDLIVQKVSVIKRCLTRIQEITNLNADSLNNLDKQDAYILNLQRAIQACIDLAQIVIQLNQWSIPKTYADAFSELVKHMVLSDSVGIQMQKMCGFRNIIIHEYQKVSQPILASILTEHLSDIELYYQEVVSYLDKTE